MGESKDCKIEGKGVGLGFMPCLKKKPMKQKSWNRCSLAGVGWPAVRIFFTLFCCSLPSHNHILAAPIWSAELKALFFSFNRSFRSLVMHDLLKQHTFFMEILR